MSYGRTCSSSSAIFKVRGQGGVMENFQTVDRKIFGKSNNIELTEEDFRQARQYFDYSKSRELEIQDFDGKWSKTFIDPRKVRGGESE